MTIRISRTSRLYAILTHFRAEPKSTGGLVVSALIALLAGIFVLFTAYFASLLVAALAAEIVLTGGTPAFNPFSADGVLLQVGAALTAVAAFGLFHALAPHIARLAQTPVGPRISYDD